MHPQLATVREGVMRMAEPDYTRKGEIERIGSDRPIAVDVRVLVATHRNVEDLVRKGQFRQDLPFGARQHDRARADRGVARVQIENGQAAVAQNHAFARP